MFQNTIANKAWLLSVVLLLIGAAWSCKNTVNNGDGTSTEMDSTAVFSPSAPSQTTGHPIDVSKAEYSITTAHYKEDPHIGMPSFDIYLHITGTSDSLLVARDYAASIFNKAAMDSYAKLIPADAVFLINSFYAGAGYYYYGIPEKNMLKIYRLFQEEGNPDNDGINQAPPEPQLMKTAKIYTDHIEVAQFAIDGEQ